MKLFDEIPVEVPGDGDGFKKESDHQKCTMRVIFKNRDLRP